MRLLDGAEPLMRPIAETNRAPRVLTDVPHALGPRSTRLAEVWHPLIAAWVGESRERRIVALWWYGRHYDHLVTFGYGKSTKLLAALLSLSRRPRRLIVLEFIAASRPGWPTLLNRILTRPLLRRTLAGVHAMTSWEAARYHDDLGLDRDQVTTICVPAIASDSLLVRPQALGRAGIVASGRAACDWSLLFDALRDTAWPLTVICGAADAPRVTDLARARSNVTVLVDISGEEHAARLARAAVYVLPLRDVGYSAGQLRVMNAATAGTPVVATAVRGIADQLTHGKTGLLVPAGDAAALRAAIEAVLGDRATAVALATEAQARGRSWTNDDYERALAGFIDRICQGSNGDIAGRSTAPVARSKPEAFLGRSPRHDRRDWTTSGEPRVTRRAGAPRLIDWTGERCVPWTGDVEVVYEHMHRYLWATEIVAGRRVLDLGSGEGYGSALLGEVASGVVGLDIDPWAIEHSRHSYRASDLTFVEGSAIDLSRFDTGSFGAVVAFEIIEHVAQHERVLDEILRVLSDDGVLIISTPDRQLYTDASGNANPFHLRELSLSEFSALIGSRFEHHAIWGQRGISGSYISAVTSPSEGHQAESQAERRSDFFLERTGKDWRPAAVPAPLYLIAVASHAPLTGIASRSTLGGPEIELLRAAARGQVRTQLLRAERSGRRRLRHLGLLGRRQLARVRP